MKTLRTFVIGALLGALTLATPYAQDPSSIIRLTNDGWLVGAGNAVPLLLGSNGKPYIKISETGAITYLNSASSTIVAADGTATLPGIGFADGTGLYRPGANQIALVGSGNVSNNVSIGIFGGGILNLVSNSATGVAIDGANSRLIMRDTWAITWGSSATSSPDLFLTRGAADVLMLGSGDSLNFGGVAAANVKLKANGSAILEIKSGDDATFGTLSVGRVNSSAIGNFISISGNMLIGSTAPTISSGFGTSPSVVNSNGPAAFTVNVGTGGVATSGVIGLPTATTGWACFAIDRNTNVVTRQTATTTTTATLTAASAWTASDILQVSCFAY